MADLPRVPLVHAPTPLVKRSALDALSVARPLDQARRRHGRRRGGQQASQARAPPRGRARARQRHDHHVRRPSVQPCTGHGLDVRRAWVCRPSCSCASKTRCDTQLPRIGNVLLDRLAGAEVRLVSHAEYAQRSAVMEGVASELRVKGRRPYVVPEGGSNGLGSLGYVTCMREVREQMRLGLAGNGAPFDVVVHACGSGGTAAGVALGASRHEVAASVRAMAVCDDAAYFESDDRPHRGRGARVGRFARERQRRWWSTTRRRVPRTPCRRASSARRSSRSRARAAWCSIPCTRARRCTA